MKNEKPRVGRLGYFGIMLVTISIQAIASAGGPDNDVELMFFLISFGVMIYGVVLRARDIAGEKGSFWGWFICGLIPIVAIALLVVKGEAHKEELELKK